MRHFRRADRGVGSPALAAAVFRWLSPCAAASVARDLANRSLALSRDASSAARRPDLGQSLGRSSRFIFTLPIEEQSCNGG
jgi:hypothetical protein